MFRTGLTEHREIAGDGVVACHADLLSASGASVHFSDHPMQRLKRDVDVLSGHVVFDYDTARELAGATGTVTSQVRKHLAILEAAGRHLLGDGRAQPPLGDVLVVLGRDQQLFDRDGASVGVADGERVAARRLAAQVGREAAQLDPRETTHDGSDHGPVLLSHEVG